MIRVLENEFYYLDNFHQVLQWIAERYSDLLTDEESAFLSRFPTLPQASRALFVRMVMRKGELFRASRLVYGEIGCAVEACRPLCEQGWVEADPELSLDELFELLQKPEIGRIFQLAPHERQARKAEQLAALRERHAGRHRFSAWDGQAGDQVYRIVAKPLCDRLRLIFFGNFHQDWSEFVLSDLGVYRYEKVEFAPAARGFRSRRDIDEYLALYQCRERFLDGEPPLELMASLAPLESDNEWLHSRRHKLLFQMGQQLEKLRDWPGALSIYRATPYPGARARAIRVLEKDGQFGAAYALLQQAEAVPESEAERQSLLRMGPRLRRQLGHARSAASKPAPPLRLDLNLPPPQEDGWHVEGVVRDHLWREEAPVYYVENTLINSLFGLLFWDAIFCAVPGAFFHPFHRGPADLHSADFQQRRAAQFAACFARLDDGSYREAIRARLAEKQGIQSPFVYWEILDQELLELALRCIPAAHLRKCFERMLLDLKANRSGFPDLIQFWPEEERYNMIEVKGPGDRLQDNQLRWIAYCTQHQMPISVCYLQWTE
ncbi:VRR-NUC domain-containing protein [Massilia sp. BJB1822]|uniref:VRR-NUC domain-containing protein n=1 Tax=Massilia sp. BJB1822 TaxID=2744470 RepID=UPI0015941007|nr:VRR-NUC domain-containing protein [Massilia sp. BJB1822]NVE00257.1 VRR-NUC domain-containing protein [Massilia sp. BJB1822]